MQTVLEAHRLLHDSTLGSRVIKKKKMQTVSALASGEGTTQMIQRTFALKMAQVEAKIWPGMAYVFQVRSKAGRGRGTGVPRSHETAPPPRATIGP